MVRRVIKFKSKNLLGETRKEEKTRLNKQIIKAILKGKSSKQILGKPSIIGATKSQLARRKKLLKGIKIKKPLTVKERLAVIR